MTQNLEQNRDTLLPKFFGLYLYSSLAQKFRFVIMNNLLPTQLSLSETYDVKGSTYNRRASNKELLKINPTLKDLDFMERHPNGIRLDAIYRDLLLSTLERDVRVLASFKIMDYSLLVGIHDITAHGKVDCPCTSLTLTKTKFTTIHRIQNISYGLRGLPTKNVAGSSVNYYGGLPAHDERGHHLLVFVGIIDILQNYRLTKRLEHRFKSIVHDGSTISVNKPEFYRKRFLEFCQSRIFPAVDSNLQEPLQGCKNSPDASPLFNSYSMKPAGRVITPSPSLNPPKIIISPTDNDELFYNNFPQTGSDIDLPAIEE